MPLRNVTIANLAEVSAARAALPEHFRPKTLPSGQWHMAKWSALRVARERRRVLQRGEEWPWHIPHKQVVKRVMFKGHKRDERKVERISEIERSMARMPELIAEYRAARAAARREKRLADGGLMESLKEPRDRMEGILTQHQMAKKKGKKKA